MIASEIIILLPSDFQLECILVRKFCIFSTEIAVVEKVSLCGSVMYDMKLK